MLKKVILYFFTLATHHHSEFTQIAVFCYVFMKCCTISFNPHFPKYTSSLLSARICTMYVKKIFIIEKKKFDRLLYHSKLSP